MKALSVGELTFVAGISGLVVEYNVAIVVTRVRFPADAFYCVTGVNFFAALLWPNGYCGFESVRGIRFSKFIKMPTVGLEPTTTSLKGWRSTD